MNSHTYVNYRVPDNPLQRDVLVPRPQCEGNFRSSRKRVRVEYESALQA